MMGVPFGAVVSPSPSHHHRMQFLKKSKKSCPPPQPLASGIPSHTGDVVPLSSPEREPGALNRRGREDRGAIAERPTEISPGRPSKDDHIGQNARGFGSLKAALEAVSDIYAHREVRLRYLVLNAHTNTSAGNQPRWRQGQKHDLAR